VFNLLRCATCAGHLHGGMQGKDFLNFNAGYLVRSWHMAKCNCAPFVRPQLPSLPMVNGHGPAVPLAFKHRHFSHSHFLSYTHPGAVSFRWQRVKCIIFNTNCVSEQEPINCQQMRASLNCSNYVNYRTWEPAFWCCCWTLVQFNNFHR